MKKTVICLLVAGIVSVTFVVAPMVLADSEDDEKEIAGSIQVPGKHASLAKMAKITLVDAVNAALKHTPGTAIEAELEVDDGFLVFEIEIVTDKNIVEVVVDAGNKKILKTEIEDDESDDEDGDKDDDKDDKEDDDRKGNNNDGNNNDKDDGNKNNKDDD